MLVMMVTMVIARKVILITIPGAQGIELNNVQNIRRKCPSFYLSSLTGSS